MGVWRFDPNPEAPSVGSTAVMPSYKALYVQMAESLAVRQQTDGSVETPTWMIQSKYNVWESSGTRVLSPTASPGESIMGS